MKHLIFPLLLLLLTASACTQANIDLDNAGDQALSITVDEITYPLKAGAYQKLQLEPGPHRVIVKDSNGKTLEEETFNVKEGGLLNVAREEYYIWTDLYGDPSMKEEHLKEDWLKIGNQSYFGEFTVVEPENIYIEKRWDYDLDEDFPNDLLGWQFTEDKYIIKSKLFREQQLIEAYNKLAQPATP